MGEELLQTREAGNSSSEVDSNLETSINTLRGGGQSLPESERAFFEPGFGHDFGSVRLYTDSRAAQLAQSLNARAFTVGNDVVFGAGQYAPHTLEGKRLIAHELTHVVQQGQVSSGFPNTVNRISFENRFEKEADTVSKSIERKQVSILHQGNTTGIQPQRKPDKQKGGVSDRRNVVFILSPDVGKESPVIAPGVKPIHVSTLKQMKEELKKINYPIGTLFIISHALPSGDLGFGTRDSIKFEMPSKIAEAFKETIKLENAPELVDFRGCTIGQNPKAMEAIRTSLAAGAAIGGNCYLVTLPNGPVKVNGKKITKASDVTAGNREPFKNGFSQLIESFGHAKRCILDKTEEGYFKAGGIMVAAWYSPTLDEKWDERKSRCYKELKMEPVDPTKVKEGEFDPGIGGHCRLIKVEKKEP